MRDRLPVGQVLRDAAWAISLILAVVLLARFDRVIEPSPRGANEPAVTSSAATSSDGANTLRSLRTSAPPATPPIRQGKVPQTVLPPARPVPTLAETQPGGKPKPEGQGTSAPPSHADLHTSFALMTPRAESAEQKSEPTKVEFFWSRPRPCLSSSLSIAREACRATDSREPVPSLRSRFCVYSRINNSSSCFSTAMPFPCSIRGPSPCSARRRR